MGVVDEGTTMGKDVGSGHILIDLARRETFVASSRCVESDAVSISGSWLVPLGYIHLR